MDPRSGAVELYGPGDDADSCEERGLVSIDPIGLRQAYADMSEFVDRVHRSPRRRNYCTKPFEAEVLSGGSRTRCPPSPNCARAVMRCMINGCGDAPLIG